MKLQTSNALARFLFTIVLMFSMFTTRAFAFEFESLWLDGVELVKQEKVRSNAVFTMPLSGIKRVNNSIRMENQKVLRGDRYSALLEVRAGLSLEQVYQSYQALLAAKGKLHFNCEKRACGTNAYWSNEIFQQRELKGRDSDQYYMAAQLLDGEYEAWVAVYLVTNSFRKSVVYIDVVLTSNSHVSEEDIGQGYLLVDGIDVRLINALKSRQTVNSIVIAAFSNNQIALQEEAKRSMLATLNRLKTELEKVFQKSDLAIDTALIGPLNVEPEAGQKSPWYRVFVY